MMIVTTTGYIIACIGPFFLGCKNNDASIVKDILLQNTDNILGWLKEVILLLALLSRIVHLSSNRMISLWCVAASEIQYR